MMRCPKCDSTNLKEVSLDREQHVIYVGYDCLDCEAKMEAIFEFFYFCLTHRSTFGLSSDDRCMYGDLLWETGADVTPCQMVRGWFVCHDDGAYHDDGEKT